MPRPREAARGARTGPSAAPASAEVRGDEGRELKWDRANHRFVVRVVKTITRPLVVGQVMAYAESDANPPPTPFRSLRVGTFAPNCTTARRFAAMEARIDNVRVSP